jgi:hypothetical protein
MAPEDSLSRRVRVAWGGLLLLGVCGIRVLVRKQIARQIAFDAE